MKKRGVRMVHLIAGLILFVGFSAYGQGNAQQNTEETLDWFLRDPEADHLQGVSAEKTYQTLLKDKPSKTVLVAVIDSGIDVEHEDLKDIIWINKDEIPGNGIDDDKNGYVDDIHGWNFLGGKDGTNVSGDTYELTREYVRLKPKYDNLSPDDVKKKDKEEFNRWLEIKNQFKEDSTNASNQYNQFTTIYENIKFSVDTLKSFLGVEELNPDLVNSVQSDDETIQDAKLFVNSIYQNTGEDADIEAAIEYFHNASDYFENKVKYGYNTSFSAHNIVGDDPNNLYEKGYGNNDVAGPDPSHGTHVAGIIGANRKNDIGIKGIADNVRIMSVRAVPDGDEHDKDVANAIIYAVDNGAQIINMSFGKDYSPQKEVVDKAVKYAESKNVLLIHAAGNDGKDIDSNSNFPSRFYLKNSKEPNNWIEVGASAGDDENLAATFSNYGKKNVQLFAPGVDVYSSVPGNKYQSNSGTSMASPAATGVAAILMSYFPDLKASEVREILLLSTRKFDNLKIARPGDGEETLFSKLSVTGGVVNAYEAVKLAQQMQQGKKIE